MVSLPFSTVLSLDELWPVSFGLAIIRPVVGLAIGWPVSFGLAIGWLLPFGLAIGWLLPFGLAIGWPNLVGGLAMVYPISFGLALPRSE
ncbi:MAG: hypothetical protein LBS44_02335 [Deltaproteobacteria bacterium]|nr:hypothetical protein [Deltaproteobacteria bacterium]